MDRNIEDARMIINFHGFGSKVGSWQLEVYDKDVIIENFQGERAPRKTVIVGNTKVIPKGEDVILTGEVWTDITQTAANIELKTKVKNKDHRVFLDGIYAFEKKKGNDK